MLVVSALTSTIRAFVDSILRNRRVTYGTSTTISFDAALVRFDVTRLTIGST